ERRRHDEQDVLQRVDRRIPQRRIVERGHVPDREDRIEEQQGHQRVGDRPPDLQRERQAQQRPKQPARRPQQQQRRSDQRDQQVLDHVSREQIAVGQGIQRRDQRDKQQQDAQHEGLHL